MTRISIDPKELRLAAKSLRRTAQEYEELAGRLRTVGRRDLSHIAPANERAIDERLREDATRLVDLSSQMQRTARDLERRAGIVENVGAPSTRPSLFFGRLVSSGGIGYRPSKAVLSSAAGSSYAGRATLPGFSVRLGIPFIDVKDIARQMNQLKARFSEFFRYGRFCGSDEGTSRPSSTRPLDSVDSCCQAHDDAYGVLRINTSFTNPRVTGKTWMWAENGYEKTRHADGKIARCIDRSRCGRNSQRDCESFKRRAAALFRWRARLGAVLARVPDRINIPGVPFA